MQKYHMSKWEDIIYFEGLNRGIKRRKKTSSDELTVPWKQASVQRPEYLVHCIKSQVNTPSDEPTIYILVAPDECQGRSSWRQRRRMHRRSIGGHRRCIRWVKKSRPRAASCRGLSTGWTDGGSSGSSDDYEDANSRVLARNPSAPDEPTVSRGASDEWRQQSCNGYVT
jgi:hypothetical protein